MMFGDTCFEMMRTFRKRTFRLNEHLDRLYASAQAVGIEIPYTKRELHEAHENLLIQNRHAFSEDDEIRSLINVSRGTLPIYESMGLPMGPWVMMTCFPLRWIIKGSYKLYQEGVHAVIPSQRTIPAQYLDPKIKNRSRLHYKLADIEAKRQDPNAWALLLDDHGFVAEGSGSNFFIVKEREIFTPQGNNCLRGISRAFVFNLCRSGDLQYRECNLEDYDVMTADEAFFTCTPYSILPCTRFNFRPIGDGQVGKVTKRLIHLWGESVNCHFVEQARKWDEANS